MKRCATMLAITLTLICAAKLTAHPPTAFVMDDAKNLYFTYWGGTWKLAPDGRLSKFHSNDFHFLAIDPGGRFASAETPALRITPSGSKPALFAFSDYPATFHTDEYLYMAPWSVGRIRLERMKPGGSKSVFVDKAIDPRIARQGGRHEGGILAIASASNGLLYVSDGASVWSITAQGTVSPVAENINVPNCPTDLPAELPRPHIRSLGVDTNGDIYAAAIGCRVVLRITSKGQIAPVLKSEAPWSPCAVVVANGELFVMEYDNTIAERREDGRPRIRKVSRDGRITVLAVIEGAPRK